MAIKEFTVKQKKEMLSENFTVEDFWANNSYKKIILETRIAQIWEQFYQKFGVRPTLTKSKNSAFRTLVDNEKCGGAKRSKHLEGIAVDFVCEGVSPLALAQFAEKQGVGGIGIYGKAQNYSKHIHIDTRGVRNRWWDINSNIKTYYFGGIACVFQKGDRSPAIASIQQKLVEFGFENSAETKILIDGIFGEKTKQALIEFQKKIDVFPDGIFGKKTNEKLNIFDWSD